ncbi:TauD/TfdA family dioxygenase [Actinomadura atramentaria]|uniref:TauD/TfdA family dioxygenase n=1 Tax=Actinomadura atramentaria TaxID=1990 RepID=UPI000378FD13|nr:TauD/TfdA family dioxygenase [Actinomadura atramentaria]
MPTTTADTDTAVLDLPESARRALADGLRGRPDPADDIDAALLALYPLFAALPPAALGEIRDFGRYPDAPAALLLRGLPTDAELPPTPVDGGPARGKTTFVSEGVLLGLTQLIGEPAGYTTEKDGRLIHDIVPVDSGQRSQTNQSSSVFLNFHNDITYDDCGRYNVTNPDFLILVCVKASPDGRGATFYASARAAVAALDPRDAAALREPDFRMNAPGTYCREHADGRDVWSSPVPVLSGPADRPEIAASANGVRPLNARAEAAWRALQEVCQRDDVAFGTLLRPGDALLINNRKGLHARDPFHAAFDGRDRWLQRTYVRRSLWEQRHRSTGVRRIHH